MKTPLLLAALTCALNLALGQNTEPPSIHATVVGLQTVVWKTAEPCPTCLVVPGVVNVHRTGPVGDPLVVFLSTDGTASPGEDYLPLPDRVEIPAGESSVTVRILPKDDLIPEGPEIIRIQLVATPNASYRLDPGGSVALIAISDDEKGPAARLDIIDPEDGDRFEPGSRIEVSALAIWSEGEIHTEVQFFAGDALIGTSPAILVRRQVIPCLPNIRTIAWENAPQGRHTLHTRTVMPNGEILRSPSVEIVVGEDATPGVVWIEATRRIAEETAAPLRRVNLIGEFTVFRSGATKHALPVFVHYSGSATAGVDYEALPWRVTIPAGKRSHSFLVTALYDQMPEGIETVVATLSNCPPKTDPPLGLPCYEFALDPVRQSATVFIREDGLSVASLHITHPEQGDHFEEREPIRVQAVAIHLEGYISSVRFYDGNTVIGLSEIVFIRAPDPGSPIHHQFEWLDAAPGAHTLTVRAAVNSSTPLVSAPVEIIVANPDLNPMVRVVATDSFAVEPNGTVNTATFRIRRYGSQSGDLEVGYSMDGRAENGVDYERLSGTALVPDGSSSVDIVVRPLADDVDEKIETVILRLSESESYRIGWPRRAVAVISDRPWAHPPGGVRCIRLGDGLVHVCFVAESGGRFRLEGTSNLRDWSTLFDLISVDGAIHHVEDEAPDHAYRFFRIIPQVSE